MVSRPKCTPDSSLLDNVQRMGSVQNVKSSYIFMSLCFCIQSTACPRMNCNRTLRGCATPAAAASNLLKGTLQLALKRRLSRKSPIATASRPQLPFFVVSSSARKSLTANKFPNPCGKDVGVGGRSRCRADNFDGQNAGSATPLHAMARCPGELRYSVSARE